MTDDISFTIALVDDHEATRRTFRSMLEGIGISNALEAENGRKFLDYLDAGGIVPDTCLLDLSMPVMNGYETARALHANYPQIKILAYSSTNDHEYVERQILSCGAHRFLPKGRNFMEYYDALCALAVTQSH